MKKILVISVLAFLLINCKKTGNSITQECTYDSCAIKAPASEIQNVQNYLSTNSISAIQHCSGLFYSVEIPGSGTTPLACSNVTVKYVGKLTNGTVFDQTPGTNVASFYLSRVIRGWTNGVPLLKQGGRIHLYIPPSLGYGNQSNGTIPANSILIFDVDLVTVY